MTPYMGMKLLAESSERGRLDAQSKLAAAQSELSESNRDLENWQRKACEAAEREAALREELAEAKVRENLLLNNPRNVFKQMCDLAIKQRDDFSQRLTAAEQRNALVESLLRESLEEDDGTSDWIDRVTAALRDKPTESGASE